MTINYPAKLTFDSNYANYDRDEKVDLKREHLYS